MRRFRLRDVFPPVQLAASHDSEKSQCRFLENHQITRLLNGKESQAAVSGFWLSNLQKSESRRQIAPLYCCAPSHVCELEGFSSAAGVRRRTGRCRVPGSHAAVCAVSRHILPQRMSTVSLFLRGSEGPEIQLSCALPCKSWNGKGAPSISPYLHFVQSQASCFPRQPKSCRKHKTTCSESTDLSTALNRCKGRGHAAIEAARAVSAASQQWKNLVCSRVPWQLEGLGLD